MARPRRNGLRSERRQAILDAAMKVFAQRGYAAATIRAIAHEAKIAQGTIYLYFSSKRDILLALYRSMIVESLEEIMARPVKGDDEGFLRSLLVDRIHRIRQNARAARFAFMELPFHEELREKFYRDIVLEHLGRIRDFFRDRIAQKKFRLVRPEIAARAFQGMYLIFALAEVVFGDVEVGRLTPEEIADEVVGLFLHGAARKD